jgi:release factor glutamine methyltransferase
MDYKFYVDKRNFIPRPETERLVETVVESFKDTDRIVKGLDLGTGCGNIAVSIVKYLPKAYMIATDISHEALEVARLNLKRHNVVDRIDLACGDLFEFIAGKVAKFDFIVSNPPYIPAKLIRRLPFEVQYEPNIALNGGEDGLDFYRKIFDNVNTFLKTKGCIFLEIGDSQGASIYRIVKENRNLEFIRFVKDYNNKNRIVVIKKKS